MVLLGGCRQGLLRQNLCVWIAGEDLGRPFGGGSGESDGFAGEGFRAAGIGVAKEDAVERLRCGQTILCELARNGHEHGMPAAIEAYFDRIDIELGQELVEISEYARGQSLAIIFVS